MPTLILRLLSSPSSFSVQMNSSSPPQIYADEINTDGHGEVCACVCVVAPVLNVAVWRYLSLLIALLSSSGAPQTLSRTTRRMHLNEN